MSRRIDDEEGVRPVFDVGNYGLGGPLPTLVYDAAATPSCTRGEETVPVKPQSTTLETLLNGQLAELLRQQGLEAEAEQVLTDQEGRRHQVDVLVELEEQAIAIEAEFAPAKTVEADARKRLPAKPLLWRGLPIASAFTLCYPQELQKRPESQARKELGERQDLEFAQLLPEKHRHPTAAVSRSGAARPRNRYHRGFSNHVSRMPPQLLAAGR